MPATRLWHSKIIECHVQPFVLLQLFEKPFEVGDYFALILFEFHSLKSFDVTRDFLEDDVFRRHVLFRQRADIGVDDILLGPFRYYMKRVHSERRQTVAFVVEIVTRGVMGVQQVFRRFQCACAPNAVWSRCSRCIRESSPHRCFR